MHTFMIFAQILVLVLVFSALLLILHTDVTNMQQMMVFFLVCSLVQNAGYLLELASKEPQAALWAIKMQYLGSGWVILFFFAVYLLLLRGQTTAPSDTHAGFGQYDDFRVCMDE